nr:glycosyltransferase 8 domain-containing protein 1-like [Procambarus clarkii]
MVHTKLKVCVVVAGIGWCVLLVYVMSSLKWHPGDITNSHRHSSQASQVDNVPLARAAKSHVLLGELIEAAKINSGNQSKVKTVHNTLPIISSNVSSAQNSGKAVNIVISGDAETLVGVTTAMNSIVSNTKSSVHFYITLPKIVIPDFRKWVLQTVLHRVNYTVRPHVPQIPKKKPHFAKIYLKSIFPELDGRFIYLDTDVIIQGDVRELIDVAIKSSHLGAFADDCQLGSKRFNLAKPRYSTHINLQHHKLKGVKIKPKACTFNTDVFVGDMTAWKASNISNLLMDWVNSSKSDPIYGLEPEANEAEAAILIVMYNRVSPLPQPWHVGDLGVTPGARYSKEFIKKAKLLHWNGHFKPWSRRAAFMESWIKYYIPDPDKKYKPVKINT